MIGEVRMTNDPRFPIGKFHFDGTMTEQQKAQCLDDIEQTPARLRAAVRGLNDQQLDTPYRDGGWTVRQVVHHVPDSHMNSYVRFKLALTEDEPTIRPYMENLWAELPEAKSAPIELSLSLLESLHKRWILALREIKPEDWKRNLRHPELGLVSLEKNLAIYAWHGKHHVAHITSLRDRMGW
jgi:DinB family protein